nr:hypothetical protein OG999_20640 [Streptomyces sp. NBC_00886]
MADEQYRWLDRETAERLLRGESLEAVDPAARDQAERLAKTLGVLSAEHPLGSAELPGEEAALAAFRTARTGNDVERAALGRRGRVQSSDAGLVRLGRPASTVRDSRWGRPARFGLTAALALGMVGAVAVAVAVAAGTGVLRAPFGNDDPAPGASVSAAVTPDRPLVSPSPKGTGASDTPTAGGGNGGSGGSSGETTGSGTGRTPSADPGDDKSVGSGSWWRGITSSCRDVRDGKALDPGRRRTLDSAAGGTSHVWTYCKGLLQPAGGSDDQGGDGNGGRQGDGDQQGQGDQGGDDEGQTSPIAPGGSGGDGGDGGHKDNDAVAVPGSSTFTPLTRRRSSTPVPTHTTRSRQTPAPGPTYSAL